MAMPRDVTAASPAKELSKTDQPLSIPGLRQGSREAMPENRVSESDNPAYLAGRERSCEGMRLAGVPEG
jgi:hypothetical protein